MGRAFVVYTALRAGLFVGAYGLALVVGLRGLLAIAAGLLVSSLASPFLLRRQRDELAAALLDRRERRLAEKDRLRGMLDG